MNDHPVEAEPITRSSGRWLLVALVASVGGLLAGGGLSAYLYSGRIATATAKVEQLQTETSKAQQDLQVALAQLDQLRTADEAEKARLVSDVQAKTAEADAARAALDEANRKAADAERQRLALVQEKSKSKTDEAARIAEAQAELKRAESALKQKAAEIEKQKQTVAVLQADKTAPLAPAQSEMTLHALAGTWQGTLESKGKTMSGTMELIEHGKGLDGTCTSLELCDGPNYTLIQSSLQQSSVTLVFKNLYEFHMDLTVSPDGSVMEGTWSHGDMFGTKHSGTVTFRKS